MSAQFINRRQALRLATASGAAFLAGAGPVRDSQLPQVRKVYTPEQVEKELLKGKLTVRFRVATTGMPTGLLPKGTKYSPLLLIADTNLADKRNRFQVFLVGEALTAIHEGGMNRGFGDPFRGKDVEVTGVIHYINLPRITGAGGGVEVPKDGYIHFQMVIDSIDNFRVISR